MHADGELVGFGDLGTVWVLWGNSLMLWGNAWVQSSFVSGGEGV